MGFERETRCTAAATLLLGGLLAFCGCEDTTNAEGPSGRRSSQRTYLEKLVVKPMDLAAAGAETPSVALTERWIVAHNGYGHADVGGLVETLVRRWQVEQGLLPNAAVPADEEERAPAEDDSGAVAVEDEAPLEPVALPKPTPELVRQQLGSEPAARLIAKVRPRGKLEGYGEVVYATGEGEEPVTVCYRLSDYPVDYLRESQVSASGGEAGEAAATEATLGVVRCTADAEGLGDGRTGWRVGAAGLDVQIAGPASQAAWIEACAREIAQRVEREIDLTREAFAALRDGESRRGPGEVGPNGFWRHLGEHVDLERKEYQPFKRTF